MRNRANSPLRVLLVSDTHGCVDSRIVALAADCEYAVHAGDVGSAAVLDALVARRGCVAVRGNNDTPQRWPPEQRATLAALPVQAMLELPGGRLAIVHGDRHGPPVRRHARLRGAFAGARCIVYGHSHRLCVDTDAEPWVVNPGAGGRARTYGGPSCVILDIRGECWRLGVIRV
ncbi:MAG: metallophosphoesterase [Gammaproteobacteria bacterium]